MSNPISPQLRIGTIGELLVQLRLLQYDVQAAAPLKDSGNDLIAVKARRFHTIQVKTTVTTQLPPWPHPARIYTMLAIVRLTGEEQTILLDNSEIYLIPFEAIATLQRTWDDLQPFAFSAAHVDQLFQPTIHQ